VDWESLQPLDGFADRVAADRCRHDALHIGDVEPVASCPFAINVHIDVAAPSKAVREGGCDPRHLADYRLDLARQLIDDFQIRARDLDADWALDPGGQHIDAVAYRRNPDIRQSRYLNHLVKLQHQPVRGHARAPLTSWLELNGGLEHLERCRISRCLSTARFTEYPRHFGHAPYQTVCLLDELSDFAGRNTWECRGHVQQVTLIKRRHELRADMAHGVHGCKQH